MRDLKEAGAKPATQTWCEPLVGFSERARYQGLLKPDILSYSVEYKRWVGRESAQSYPVKGRLCWAAVTATVKP